MFCVARLIAIAVRVIKHSSGSTEVEASRWKHKKEKRDCWVDVVINLRI